MKKKYTVMNIFGTMSKKCCSRHRLAANVLRLGEEADLTAQKMIEEQMFNQPIQRQISQCTQPNRCNQSNLERPATVL